MGPRRRAAAVLHGLGGALSLLGLLTTTIAIQARAGWAAVGVGVGMAGLGIATELLAQRLAPPRDAASQAASRRHGALGSGLALAAVPLFLGVILLTGQFGTTRQFLDTAVTTPGASCCRGDLAFPLGGLFAAWGLALGLAVALPVRDTATRFGPAGGARLRWALWGAAAALPVVVLVQLADWQAGSAVAVALVTALPPALVVTAVAVLGFRRRLVVAVGGVSRHTGPVRRDVPLRDDTFVALVGGAHVVIRHGGRGIRVNLHAWGRDGNLPRRLHRALQLSNVPGNYDVLGERPGTR